MGFLTSRRLRERQAQEAAGLPPPAPRPPDEIPYHQHISIVQDIKREHQAQVASLRAQVAAGGAGDTAEQAKALQAALAENAELRAQVDQLTAPKAPAHGEPQASSESPTGEEADPKAKTGSKRFGR